MGLTFSALYWLSPPNPIYWLQATPGDQHRSQLTIQYHKWSPLTISDHNWLSPTAGDHNRPQPTTNAHHKWPLLITTDHEWPSTRTAAIISIASIDWPISTDPYWPPPASLLTTGIQWPSIMLHYLHTRLVNAVVNNRRRWSVALSVVIERKNPHTQYWPWPTFIYIYGYYIMWHTLLVYFNLKQ